MFLDGGGDLGRGGRTARPLPAGVKAAGGSAEPPPTPSAAPNLSLEGRKKYIYKKSDFPFNFSFPLEISDFSPFPDFSSVFQGKKRGYRERRPGGAAPSPIGPRRLPPERCGSGLGPGRASREGVLLAKRIVETICRDPGKPKVTLAVLPNRGRGRGEQQE